MERRWSAPLRYVLPVLYYVQGRAASAPSSSAAFLEPGVLGPGLDAPRKRRISGATARAGSAGGGLLKHSRPAPVDETEEQEEQHPPIDVVIPYVIATEHQMEQFRAFCHNQHVRWFRRMRDLGTLELLLLSIERYLPFVRKVHIVNNGELPNWLTTRQFGYATLSPANQGEHFARSPFWAEETGRLHFVSHQEMWNPKSRDHDLPTFNTDAIFSQIGRIPGLAEHFVYVEDDMIFLRPISPHDLFDFRTTDASDIRGESGQELVPRFGRPYLLGRQADLPKERRPEPEAGKKGSHCPVGFLYASHMATVLRKSDLAKALQQINAMTKKEMRTNMVAHLLMTEDERRAADTGYDAGQPGLSDMVPRIKCRTIQFKLAPCDESFRFRVHWVLFHYFGYQASPLEQVRGEGTKTTKGSGTTTPNGKQESKACASKRSPYFWHREEWDKGRTELDKLGYFENLIRTASEEGSNCPAPALACMQDNYAGNGAQCEAEITALHALLQKFVGGPGKLQHLPPPRALCAAADAAANEPETAGETLGAGAASGLKKIGKITRPVHEAKTEIQTVRAVPGFFPGWKIVACVMSLVMFFVFVIAGYLYQVWAERKSLAALARASQSASPDRETREDCGATNGGDGGGANKGKVRISTMGSV